MPSQWPLTLPATRQSQFGFLGLENHTPATTARFLDDAVV
jgi:hypothetical protein